MSGSCATQIRSNIFQAFSPVRAAALTGEKACIEDTCRIHEKRKNSVPARACARVIMTPGNASGPQEEGFSPQDFGKDTKGEESHNWGNTRDRTITLK